MEPIIGTLALLATKLNYGQVNAESCVVEWVRGGPDYFFLFFISIIDYTAPTFSTISTLKSPGYDPSNVLSLWFHHSFDKVQVFWEGNKIFINLAIFLTLLRNVEKIGIFYQSFVIFSEYLNFSNVQIYNFPLR